MDADVGRPMYAGDTVLAPIHDSSDTLRPFYKSDLERTDPLSGWRAQVNPTVSGTYTTVELARAAAMSAIVSALNSTGVTLTEHTTTAETDIEIAGNSEDGYYVNYALGHMVALELRLFAGMAAFDAVREFVEKILVAMRRRWTPGLGSYSTSDAANIGYTIHYGVTATEPENGAEIYAAATKTISGTGLPVDGSTGAWEKYLTEFTGADLTDIILAAGDGVDGPLFWLCFWIETTDFGAADWTDGAFVELILFTGLHPKP